MDICKVFFLVIVKSVKHFLGGDSLLSHYSHGGVEKHFRQLDVILLSVTLNHSKITFDGTHTSS